jgi:hypothetical protein
MAMACCLPLTRVPLFPLIKVPSFNLCIARLTDRCALLPYLAIMHPFLKGRARVSNCLAIQYFAARGGDLVHLVSLFYLVCLVHLVGERNKPDKRDKLDKLPSPHTAMDQADP